MVRWIVQTPEAEGTFNVTAPHPVTNREFARALGRSLKRPAPLPGPRLRAEERCSASSPTPS